MCLCTYRSSVVDELAVLAFGTRFSGRGVKWRSYSCSAYNVDLQNNSLKTKLIKAGLSSRQMKFPSWFPEVFICARIIFNVLNSFSVSLQCSEADQRSSKPRSSQKSSCSAEGRHGDMARLQYVCYSRKGRRTDWGWREVRKLEEGNFFQVFFTQKLVILALGIQNLTPKRCKA